jgi:hypothetical protein
VLGFDADPPALLAVAFVGMFALTMTAAYGLVRAKWIAEMPIDPEEQ